MMLRIINAVVATLKQQQMIEAQTLWLCLTNILLNTPQTINSAKQNNI
jgi:hypothetical protein